MKEIAIEDVDEVRQSDEDLSSPEPATASQFWLRKLFWLARHFPGFLKLLRRPLVWAAVHYSDEIRRGTFANARRILGPDLSQGKCMKFARGVVGNFYDFVVDVGRSGDLSPEDLRARIESIEGHEEYLAIRQRGSGAIILTAHIGSFELGMAALAALESHIHVVFKRDAVNEFDAIRQTLRKNLGVIEAPIDDGWQTWVTLRDALENNHVVVMQGDRAMPGQKAQAIPMFGAHLLLPLGPIKLAQISGSPIIPVFVIKTAGGKFRLFVQPAIDVDPAADLLDGLHPQLVQWGKVIEKFVAEYPEQWLMLQPAFAQDIMLQS